MSPRRFHCVSCKKKTAARFDYCTTCHSWGTCERLPEAADAADLPTLDTIETLNPPRASVGQPWDAALGGGIALGTQIALWGRPGAHKTTEALRFVASVGGLFIESEFPDLGLLRRFTSEAKIDARGITPFYAERPRDAARIIASRTWPIAAVDSLNALCGASATRRELRESLELLRNAASASGSTLIVIMQATRAGRANAPTWIEHMVDTTIALSRSTIRVTKNRFGPVGVTKRRAPLALVG